MINARMYDMTTGLCFSGGHPNPNEEEGGGGEGEITTEPRKPQHTLRGDHAPTPFLPAAASSAVWCIGCSKHSEHRKYSEQIDYCHWR